MSVSPTLSIRSAPVLAVACALVFGACEEAIAADGALVPDPSAAVFGPVRGVREELTISLTNIARGPVTLESISIEGQVGRDFSIDARGLPATVASGGRYVFTLVRAADARDAIVDAALIVRASLEREPILRFPLFSGRARLLGGGTVDGKAPGGSFFEMSVGPPVGAPSHRPIAIELEASHRNGVAVSLFARWGRPATPFDHDARAAADRSPTQTLRIAPRDDELFLLVGANTEDGTPADITVRVERPPIALVSSTPERGRAQGPPIFLDVRGIGLGPDVLFAIERSGGGPAVSAPVIRRYGLDRVELEVIPSPLPPGFYDVVARIVLGGQTHESRLPRALELTAGSIGARFGARIRVVDTLRRGTIGIAALLYQNSGDVPVAPPWIRVSYVHLPNVTVDTGTVLATSVSGPWVSDAIDVLGVTPGDPHGLLQPSPRFTSIPIYFEGDELGKGDLRVSVLGDEALDDAIDWDALPVPAGVEPAAWPLVRSRLELALGDTWGEVRAALAAISARLALRAPHVTSGAALLDAFRFAVRDALDRPTSAITGSLRDSSGAPLANVEVVALVEDIPVASATTDPSGRFVIDGLFSAQSFQLVADGLDIGVVERFVPADADVLGVELVALSSGPARPRTGCPPCDPQGLPLSVPSPSADAFDVLTRGRVVIVAAIDPNSKDGPSGDGPGELFREAHEDLDYIVSFANEAPEGFDPEVLAPALRVEIFDELEEDFAIDSFRFGPVWLNEDAPVFLAAEDELCFISPGIPCISEVSPPAVVSQDVFTMIPDGDGGFLHAAVRVVATIDHGARRATWTFESIAPFADGPIEPFLPVHLEEDESAFGTGIISFTIDATDDGDEECEEIENDAKIRFDVESDDDEDEINTRITNLDVRFVDCPEPAVPSNPAPAHDATIGLGEALSSLSWMGDGRDDTSFAVRLERGGALYVEDDTASESLPLASILPGPYRWRVTATNPRASVDGPWWEFTVESAGGTAAFVRGDVDANGSIVLTDAIVALGWLFLGGTEPSCLDAADVNGDLSNDITDPIYLLSWLFSGGSPPGPPAPSATQWVLGDCGLAPDAEALGCDSFPACE